MNINLKNNTLLLPLVLLLPSSNTLYGASFFSYFFPSQEAALIEAAKKGDGERIKQLISQGVNVNAGEKD